MIKDLRANLGMCNSLEKVYLVDDCKRITSSYFNVWVPSMMNGIEQGLDAKDEVMDVGSVLNEDTSHINLNVKTEGCIRARSIHGYRFRHDGWIPEFKTETSTYQTMTIESGTGGEINAGSSDGVTEKAGEGPHTHGIKAAIKLAASGFKNFIFNKLVSNQMVHTNSTEVDYQELNKVYIKKGHVLYGHFVSGGDGPEFLITFIDDVIPYYDEDEDNGSNDKLDSWKWKDK